MQQVIAALKERRAYAQRLLMACDTALAAFADLDGAAPSAPVPAAPRSAPERSTPPVHTARTAHGVDPVVAARDAAILARLKAGQATRSQLVESLPVIKGKTPEQTAADCSNALTRLKYKRLVKQTDNGCWVLT